MKINEQRNWDEDSYVPFPEEQNDIEFVEDYEEENEDYPIGYSPIQGNWDWEELEDESNFQKIGRKVRKIQSVKTYDAIRERERNSQKKKIRSEAKAREKQRQSYYHYGEGNE